MTTTTEMNPTTQSLVQEEENGTQNLNQFFSQELNQDSQFIQGVNLGTQILQNENQGIRKILPSLFSTLRSMLGSNVYHPVYYRLQPDFRSCCAPHRS